MFFRAVCFFPEVIFILTRCLCDSFISIILSGVPQYQKDAKKTRNDAKRTAKTKKKTNKKQNKIKKKKKKTMIRHRHEGNDSFDPTVYFKLTETDTDL